MRTRGRFLIATEAAIAPLAAIWVLAAREKERVNGLVLPQATDELVAELAEIAEEYRQAQVPEVPKPGRPKFRPEMVQGMTIDVATYARQHGVSDSYVRRLCRLGKMPAVLERGAWRIVATETPEAIA